MRILALIPEAFGGHGGIAQYNRDLLEAICLHPHCAQIVALPRVIREPTDSLPQKLCWLASASQSTLMFCLHLLKAIIRGGPFDLVLCSHINLLSLAWVASVSKSAPLVLVIYGIDAWAPTRRVMANRLVRRLNAVITISNLTRHRFVSWSGCTNLNIFLIPNAIRLNQYHVGKPKRELIDRHKLSGCQILLSLGRMSSAEQYKGIDDVIEILPELATEIPNIRYIVAGQGDDLDRLSKKAYNLNILDKVIFTGYIAEAEKRDYYCLADAFVLAGRGEGFGFVFLEAMACGVPVVASALDGSREAVREGQLGLVVDPNDKTALKSGILEALKRPHEIPAGLEYFSFENFVSRVHEFFDSITCSKNGIKSKLENL